MAEGNRSLVEIDQIVIALRDMNAGFRSARAG